MDTKFTGENTWSEHPEYNRGFEAGQQSKQEEVNKLQEEIDVLKKKYDAMYNAFVVADDCRKEWHGCFTRAREEKDRLQSIINQAVSCMDSGCSGSLSPMLKIRRILKGE